MYVHTESNRHDQSVFDITCIIDWIEENSLVKDTLRKWIYGCESGFMVEWSPCSSSKGTTKGTSLRYSIKELDSVTGSFSTFEGTIVLFVSTVPPKELTKVLLRIIELDYVWCLSSEVLGELIEFWFFTIIII